MNKKIIEAELLKKTPDWLLISNLAKELYRNTLQTNPLGFKKGAINIIRCAEQSISTIIIQLKKCFDSDEYQYFNVGGRYYNVTASHPPLTVTQFKKELPILASSIKDSDKYIIIVTNEEQIQTNSLLNGFECNIYKANISNLYSVNQSTITIIGDGIKVKAKLDELKSEIRNLVLNSILN